MGPFSRPGKTGFRFGNMLGSGILSVSYRNVTAALSLLNKDYNSIYSNYILIFPFVNIIYPVSFVLMCTRTAPPRNCLVTSPNGLINFSISACHCFLQEGSLRMR